MDVKLKEGSDYKNCTNFLTAVSFHFQYAFYWTNLREISLRAIEMMPRFFAFLWFANKRTINFIDTSLICSVYQPLVLNTTVNILELGRINILPRATSQFHFLIKFHFRFQRHDQQQRTSVIENTMLTNDRSANDFQIQWQSCKNESGEYSKYWETHPQFYSNEDN